MGVLVPDEDAGAVAVHDARDGLGEVARDLLAGPGGGDRARELEQGARLVVLALRVGQSGRRVEHGGGEARVDLELVALLGEEAAVGGIQRDQPAVVAAVRADLDDEPRAVAVVGLGREQLVRGAHGLVVGEAAVVDLQLVAVAQAHGEQVARRAHGGRRAVGDAAERALQAVVGDQVARRGVGVVETLAHRHQASQVTV